MAVGHCVFNTEGDSGAAVRDWQVGVTKSCTDLKVRWAAVVNTTVGCGTKLAGVLEFSRALDGSSGVHAFWELGGILFRLLVVAAFGAAAADYCLMLFSCELYKFDGCIDSVWWRQFVAVA